MKILMWFEEHNKISWLVTIIIAALMFYISSIEFGPGSLSPGASIRAILYHIFAYAALAFFLSISIVRGRWKSGIFLAVLIAILYGVSDEYHQLFVPGRAGTIRDVILDSIGVFLASLFYYVTIEYRSRK